MNYIIKRYSIDITLGWRSWRSAMCGDGSGIRSGAGDSPRGAGQAAQAGRRLRAVKRRDGSHLCAEASGKVFDADSS